MSDGFEMWTRSEIVRLRAEADALERTLERFLSSRPLATNRQTLLPVSHNGLVGASINVVSRKRRSKNDALLEAIDQAGTEGLSLDEIMTAADRAGIDSNRNTIRSFCWNEKQRGRLIQPDVGRFASSLVAKDEAAGGSLLDEPAASTRSDHNQHREGDAVGGI
jgi:hypothetical protein